MIYSMMVLCGLAGVILANKLAEDDMIQRQQYYKQLLHTRFVCVDSNTGADLSATHYVLGRRKRRCDLCLDHDDSISKIHAVLWHDGDQFCIAPKYNWNLNGNFYYPKVLVNGSPVPPAGCRLRYGDVIRMGNTRYMLVNTEGRM